MAYMTFLMKQTHLIKFLVPDKVPWVELTKTLHLKWRRELSCKFDLSPRAITYLGQKIFRGQPFNDQTPVTWGLFNRNDLTFERKFTRKHDRFSKKQNILWPEFSDETASIYKVIYVGKTDPMILS